MLFQGETTRKSWVLSYNNNSSVLFRFGRRVCPARPLASLRGQWALGRTAARVSPQCPGWGSRVTLRTQGQPRAPAETPNHRQPARMNNE